MSCPFAEEHGRRIFALEVGRESLFEGPAKEHRGPGVFLAPAIEVAMAVTTRTAQILADLGVAVGQVRPLGAVVFRCCRRQGRSQTSPLAGGGEAVKVEQGSAVLGGVA